MEMCGILAQTTELAEDVSSEEAVAALTALSADPSVHGILVFQPLPQQVSLEAMREAMNPQKDVDCLRPFVPGDFNNQNALLPCTPGAVMEMLDYYEVALKGKDVTVIGASDVVGEAPWHSCCSTAGQRRPSVSYFYERHQGALQAGRHRHCGCRCSRTRRTGAD